MKIRLLAILILIISIPNAIHAQGGTWVWVSGSSTGGLSPVRGTMGVASTTNTPGGLYEGANWVDRQGNFWIYGGVSSSIGLYGDMWKYDVVNNTWTWVNGTGVAGQQPVYGTMGVPAAGNTPGGRGWGNMSWTDNNGDLWLFGGRGYNDLWRYNIASNEWTWMTGSSTGGGFDVYGTLGVPATTNTPGIRSETTSGWVDASNNIWMFGGLGSGFTGYNDMWRYSVSTGEWTWMSGNQGGGSTGSYGTMGVTAATNLPPGRASYTHWMDASGNFYIFGGWMNNNYSDVWKYDPVNSLWTWIAGENYVNATGTYSAYCTDISATGPMSRYENRSAVVEGCTNAFLTFGGCNDISYADNDELNDLWLFDPATSNWKWISGTNTFGNLGSYGTMGVASPTNLPPARCGGATWVDNQGVLWLFGGSLSHFYSDIWKFIPNTSCVTLPLVGGINYTLSNNIVCAGDSAKLTLSGVSNLHISPSASVTWTDSAHANLFPTTTTTYTLTGNSSCRNNDTARFTISIAHPGALNYQLRDTQICQGSSGSLILLDQANTHITPTSSVTWQDSLHASLHPDSTTTYLITGVSTLCGGRDSARVTVHVTQHAPVSFTIPDTVICYGGSVMAHLTGLYNLTVNPLYSYFYFYDSTHIVFDPYYNSSYYISGVNSCGGPFIDTLNIHVVNTGTLNYVLSKPEICLGDSDALTLTGVRGAYIVPSAGVTWLDSSHARLHPDTNTTYHVYGRSVCSGIDSASFLVRVITPGTANYMLTNPIVCSGGSTVLYVYGLKNVSISPYAYTYYMDTVDSYSYLYPTAATTYTITGTSLCGGHDTTHVLVGVEPYPNYNLSKPFICLGDTASLRVTGVSGLQVTPNIHVIWRDSSDAILQPDTTTTYTITGRACTGLVNYTVTLQVGRPGAVNFTLSPPGGVCSGYSEYLTTVGVLNPTITPATTLYMLDTVHYYAYLYPTTTTAYTVTGRSVCGGMDTTHFLVPVLPYSNYTSHKPTICKGDSSLLSIFGLRDMQITPGTNLTWVDSAADSSHVFLHPDTTTQYTLSGLNCSGYYSTYIFTVTVLTPGVINYSFSPASVCSGYSSVLYVHGVTSVTITPSSYIYWSDPTDAYTYLYPTATTNYTIIGQSVCGGTDTAVATVRVVPSSGYTLASPSICRGDSTLITLDGLSGAHITPIAGLTWIDTAHAMLSPSVTTSYSVTGIGCNGYTSTYYFTVNVVTPGIVNYTISDTNICTGYSSYLNVTGLIGTTISPYVNLYAVDSTHSDGYIYPSTTTTYRISGRSVCRGLDTAYVTIHVNQPANLSINKTTLCNGDSAVLTLTGLSSVNISPTSGVTWLDSVHVSIKPDSSGYYYITGYSVCSGSNYYQTEYLTVASSGQLSYNMADSVICPGGSIYLTVSGVTNPVITPYSYFYYGTSYDYTYLYPTANTTYTITGQSVCGGYDTAIVHAFVSGQGYFLLASPSVCAGDSTKITLVGFSAVQITPASSVTWQSTFTAYLHPTSTTTYDITGTSLCSGSYYQPITVLVTSPSVLASINTPVICSTDSAQVCATPGYATYHWSTGQSSPCFKTQFPGNYQVTISDANGCTAQSNSTTLSVHNIPPPLAIISTTIICSNDSAQVCASTGYSTYQWNNGQSGDCFETQSAGNYYVTVTDANGCTAESNHVGLAVHPAPPVSISVNSDTLTVYNTVSQQWYLNGTAIAGAVNKVYIATSSGNYTVAVVDSNGCSTSSNIVSLKAVGIQDIAQDKVEVYPNPLSAGNWTLLVTDDLIGANAEIFDAEGRLVYKSEIRNMKSEITIDVARGVYLFRIQTSSGSLTKKLVKL